MPVPNVVTSIPGPQSLAVYERERELIAPGLQSVTQWARVCFSHGEGCALGRSMVLGFWGGYHGKTEGTRPLSEGEQVGYGLPSPGIVAAPYADPRHNPFGTEGDLVERSVDFLRELILHGTNRDIAAI